MDILFFRNGHKQEKMTLKNVNIIQHSPFLSHFREDDKKQNFPFCRTYMITYYVLEVYGISI